MKMKQDPVYQFIIDGVDDTLVYSDYTDRAMGLAVAMFSPVSEDSLEFSIRIIGGNDYPSGYVPEHAEVTVVYHIGMEPARGIINGAKQVYPSGRTLDDTE
jgi:hypothetical protein